MNEKIKISKLIIVEGKYDKIKLSSLLDADIVTTDGFGIFKDLEKREWIRRCIMQKGAIVLTDSDDAGLLIRNHIRNIVGASGLEHVIHLYTPSVVGKERRKKRSSKQGLLGVEGIEAEILRELFLPFSESALIFEPSRKITKTDFFEDGLCGAEGSADKRRALIRYFSLPENLTANALLEALNMLYSYDDYKAALHTILEEVQ